MPPKPKRKRASFNQTATRDEVVEVNIVSDDDQHDLKSSTVSKDSPAVRQVVEVVEETAVPDAIETIKKDAQEIEEAVENLEEAVDAGSHISSPPFTEHEEVFEESDEKEKSKDTVESIFSGQMNNVRPEITVIGKKDKSLAIWVGVMLGIAFAVGIGLVFLVRGANAIPSLGAKPTPTTTPTLNPTPTSAISIMRKDISVRVLNGGGVAGAASKMKTFLEDKGYKVDSTGNTKEYTYTSTVIQVKTGKDALKTLLSDDLKGDYTLEASTESVDADAQYDAIVIVGKE